MSDTFINDISKGCFVCGNNNPNGLKLKLRELEKGVVGAEFTPKNYLNGFKGILHGGIISALLDDAMDWAIYSATGKWYVTSSMTIKFKKPVHVEEKLVLKASIIRDDNNKSSKIVTKRIEMATAEIYNEKKELLASSEGKFFKVPEQEAQDLM